MATTLPRSKPSVRVLLSFALQRFLDLHKADMENAHWQRGDKGPVQECGCGACAEARQALEAFDEEK